MYFLAGYTDQAYVVHLLDDSQEQRYKARNEMYGYIINIDDELGEFLIGLSYRTEVIGNEVKRIRYCIS